MAPTVIIVPVPEAEPAVDFVRGANTPDGAEWMPAHVTLIYPFTDDSQLVAGRIAEVRRVLARFCAFEFVLSEVRRFDNLPNESYVWLAPTPGRPFVEMVDELASAFPEHPPFSGAFATVIPHLTVAASTDGDLLKLYSIRRLSLTMTPAPEPSSPSQIAPAECKVIRSGSSSSFRKFAASAP